MEELLGFAGVRPEQIALGALLQATRQSLGEDGAPMRCPTDSHHSAPREIIATVGSSSVVSIEEITSPGLPSPDKRIRRTSPNPANDHDNPRPRPRTRMRFLQPGSEDRVQRCGLKHLAHNPVADGEYPVNSGSVGS